jgi:hypothetical protein
MKKGCTQFLLKVEYMQYLPPYKRSWWWWCSPIHQSQLSDLHLRSQPSDQALPFLIPTTMPAKLQNKVGYRPPPRHRQLLCILRLPDRGSRATRCSLLPHATSLPILSSSSHHTHAFSHLRQLSRQARHGSLSDIPSNSHLEASIRE